MVEEVLAYDLRQKYAEIVGGHLELVSQARLNSDYPAYFKALENLYTIISHKFNEKKQKFEESLDEMSQREYYDVLMSRVINVCNKYKNTFLGHTRKNDEIYRIEKALRDVEMFLWYVMDKAKMFGSAGFNEGI